MEMKGISKDFWEIIRGCELIIIFVFEQAEKRMVFFWRPLMFATCTLDQRIFTKLLFEHLIVDLNKIEEDVYLI